MPEAATREAVRAPRHNGGRRREANNTLRAGNTSDPSAMRRRLVAWGPVVGLLLAMLVLRVANLQASYESQFLVVACNFVFSTLASVFIAYLAGQSFLVRGAPAVLLLGCGVVAWGSAGLVANFISRGDANLDVTIHNCGVWISAVLHLAGSVLLLQPAHKVRTPAPWLTTGYIGALGAVGLAAIWAVEGRAPVFFVPGVGGTLVRQFVLGSALAMFVLAALLIARSSRGTRSAFPAWYIGALGAIAVGLAGILIQSTIGGLEAWVGRAALWLAGVHMVLAALASAREANAWGLGLEEALREALIGSEERARQAIRVAGLGTFEHDHISDVVVFSPLMREMSGFTQQDVVMVPAIVQRVLIEDRKAFAAAVQRAHDPAGDGTFEVEYRIQNRQGRIRWLSARSQTFFEGGGTERRAVRTIGAALDITERKELQVELERQVAERTSKLEQVVADLEHFSFTITHDLKAPLRAMRGFAEMALMSEESEQERQRDCLNKIIVSARRMDALIQDALRYNQVVRQELPLEQVDTDRLLRGILDSYPELQPARAHIRIEGRMPVVFANEAGLTQCFSNLLGNAVKFVRPKQMPEIRIWSGMVQSPNSEHQSRGGAAQEWVRIYVEDKGIGISKDMLPRLFSMFSRGSRDYEGTGIGLALVRKVAHQMGGTVGVESQAGKGSRFWMELKPGAD